MARVLPRGAARINKYVQRLVRKVSAMLCKKWRIDPHDVTTAVHDAYLKYLNRRQNGKKVANLAPWLYRVADRKLLQLLKKEKKRRDTVHLADEASVIDTDREALKEFLRTIRVRRFLSECAIRIAHLPDEARKIFAISAEQVGNCKITWKTLADEFSCRFGKKLSEATVRRYRDQIEDACLDCLRS